MADSTSAVRRRNKSPRRHNLAYLESRAGLDASECNDDLAGEWTRGPRSNAIIADGGLASFSTWCLETRPSGSWVSVERHCWAIENSFETAKDELGPDHNETRCWHGWHRRSYLHSP